MDTPLGLDGGEGILRYGGTRKKVSRFMHILDLSMAIISIIL